MSFGRFRYVLQRVEANFQHLKQDYVPPGIYRGFRNMALAWAMVLPTYLHCAGYVPGLS